MFEHLCKEKDGLVWRTVRVAEPSVNWANRVIDKLQTVPNFLQNENPYFILLDSRNKFFEVDNVGIVAVLPLDAWPNLLHVHITFWDRRLRGREGLCRSLADWVTRLCGKTLFTQIPAENKVLLAFASRVGFQMQTSEGSTRTMVYLPNYTE